MTTQVKNDSAVNAILTAWRTKPENQRPMIILFGESLGAFGSQAAWPEGSTPKDVTAEIKRIIWIGPPSQSRVWKQWQADRSAGLMWHPVVGDGLIARTYISAGELERAVPSDGPVITFSAHLSNRSCTGAQTCSCRSRTGLISHSTRCRSTHEMDPCHNPP